MFSISPSVIVQINMWTIGRDDLCLLLEGAKDRKTFSETNGFVMPGHVNVRSA